jgi:aminopeptidase N
MQAERFLGSVAIRIRFSGPITRIVLNAVGLEIDRAIVTSGGVTQRAAVAAGPTDQTITVNLSAPIPPPSAELTIVYRGRFGTDLRGFYLSRANGRTYAVTQLEATDARRMFPCFDEPEYKATFDMHVIARAGETVISNAPLEAVRPAREPGTREFDFATTLPMPTYLVAVAVGDFECVNGPSPRTPLRVCGARGNRLLSGFALAAARAALDYYNEYFDIDYPFQKLDLVAIPDFAAGAMENTGAVFFRESLLLVADDATAAIKKRAAMVIAHEIAHMWFGNLVTMSWWNDLWLNEGFASWMETKALAAWKPEWDLEIDERQALNRALTIDARAETRPVRAPVDSPADIDAAFDAITYEKAAAILGMTERFTGQDRWRAGINAYLGQFKYGNATAENFWGTMTRVTGLPVDRIMTDFVTQPGVPLVSVETACRGGDTVVSLSQEPFMATAASMPQRWTIPVCLETRGDARADACYLLDRPSMTVTLTGCARAVVGNDGGEGYYRTRHGPDAWRRLIAANAELGGDERLMLLDDTWALFRAGMSSVRSVLDMTRAFGTDIRDAQVLSALGVRLQFLHEYIAGDEVRPSFEQWVQRLFRPALTESKRLGGPSESALRRRSALLGIAGMVGRDPAVLDEARREVEGFLSGRNARLPAELLDAYVGLAAINGDDALYTAYVNRTESARDPEERYRYLFALAGFGDEAQIARTFAYALSPAVRPQDRALLIGRLLANPRARDLTWRQIQRQWPQIQQQLGAFGGTGSIIDALGAFCSAPRAAEVRDFFAAHPVPGRARSVSQTVATIEACAALSRQQQDDLAAALQTAPR